MKFCIRCERLMKLQDKMYLCECGMFEHARETVKLEGDTRPPARSKEIPTDIHPLAVHSHVCSKCGFDKAQIVTKGIFVSDEDEMIGYVCGRCGHHDPEEGLKA